MDRIADRPREGKCGPRSSEGVPRHWIALRLVAGTMRDMTPHDRLRDLVGSLPAPPLGGGALHRLRTPATRVREGLLRRRRRALPDLTTAVGRRRRLGWIRPGFNNLGPSAAFVFRFARHHDVCVVAYACDGAPPRRLESVDGVPVPADLVGRVFAVGSPDWCVLSFEAASDLFLRQLLALADGGLSDLDPEVVLGSEATFLGHSQGALEGLIVRARLVAAGLGDALGDVVAIAPPTAGSTVLVGPGAGALLRHSAGAAAGPAARQAVEALGPGQPLEVLQRYGASPDGFTRVVAGRIGEGGSALFRTLAWLSVRGATGWEGHSDGMVAVDSARAGVLDERFRIVEGAADHDELFEDPAVVDVALDDV